MSKSILIIEDEAHIADLLHINLTMEGYLCHSTTRGLTAIEMLKNNKIDLILLDVLLPDSNGVDLCRKIKNSRPDIPILILSALNQSVDKIKGLKAGADD